MTGIMRIHRWARAGILGASALVLSACDDGFQLPFGQTTAGDVQTSRSAAPQNTATGLEVEAPEIFQANQDGLWDGRPSLGGVWVAHPDVTDPERVLVTNELTGDTVVGALFRRERDNFGPPIMISSDAASALNVVAGQPTQLTVVALRRQEIPQELDLAVEPPEPLLADATDTSDETALPETIAATTLASAATETDTASTATAFDVATLAENAIAVSASPAPTPAPAATLDASAILADTASASALPSEITTATLETPEPQVSAEPRPLPAAALAQPAISATDTAAPVETAALDPASTREALNRAHIQVGVFSAQENAEQAAAEMRAGGLIPNVHDHSNDERTLWRVTVGPARNAAERAALLETIQGLGYEDAYFVTN